MKKYYLIGFILLFPIVGYFFLRSGQNYFRPLPFFGPKHLNGNFHIRKGKKIPDTVYYTLPPISYENQDHKPITWANFDTNTIFVWNCFYTRSPNIGPRVVAGMDSLMRQFRIHPDVRFLSLSVDPDYDQAEILKRYISLIHADTTRRWDFLTGNKEEIYDFVRNSLFLNLYQSKLDSGINFSPKIVLIDSKHRIRGYYDGTREEDLKKLRDEIIVLRYKVKRLGQVSGY